VDKVIIWFRRDLRLADNPAWNRAVERGLAIVPVFIWAPEEAGDWAPGGASRWWLHHALEDLRGQLEEHGLKLILLRGKSVEQLHELIRETGAGAVYWNRCYEPYRMRIDGEIKSRLKKEGLDAWSGNASLLHEPWEVSTQAGSAYKVYTPYARAVDKLGTPGPETVKGKVQAPGSWPKSLTLDSFALLPDKDWDKGFYAAWTPTRQGGLGRLGAFLKSHVDAYDSARDFPAQDGTSRLSPYLHFGQVGPREAIAALDKQSRSKGLQVFRSEITWREFAYHVLYHFPDTPEKPLQPKFEQFPWERNKEQLCAWQQGRTGYPVVDAGMRQLWQTGWMHNRVRMIVGSFLVKHQLHSWLDGARWFWDTLVDADLASNTLGWQWAGGCGADAAPYFRIFNPITQGTKFDPDGAYIRQFVPELKKVPDKYLHTPWEMPANVQEACDCVIGEDYPGPVIEHKAGRERALKAFERIKGGN
jgi:deoxyribodipyrimidine photo-lyase